VELFFLCYPMLMIRLYVYISYTPILILILTRECHYLDALCAGSEEFTGVAVRSDKLVEEEGF
jgi:hypothetical protein